MKRMTYIVLALVLLLCSCGQPSTTGENKNTAPTWQEQYDLGVRYLSEGNYEEAIIAFTAAIEIDPKQAEAYVGRGDAYIGQGETEENLTAAKADYEKSIELNETNAEAYLGLANVYILQRDYDKAMDTLNQGLGKVAENQSITDMISEIERSTISASNFHKFQAYIDIEQNSVLKKQITDLIALANDGVEWDELYLWLENIDAKNVDEFYTENSGWKIHYKTNYIEIRQEHGAAYCYKTISFPSSFIMGSTSDWNWNGEYKSYSIYGGPNDLRMGWLGGPAIETKGIIVNGLCEGECRGALCHEDGTYDTYGEYELYAEYDNGYRLYPHGNDETKTMLFSATSGYTSYEDYEENELWN